MQTYLPCKSISRLLTKLFVSPLVIFFPQVNPAVFLPLLPLILAFDNSWLELCEILLGCDEAAVALPWYKLQVCLSYINSKALADSFSLVFSHLN